MPGCRKLLLQRIALAFAFAFDNMGSSKPAMMPMIAIATSSSIKVKASALRPGFLNCCNIQPDSALAEKSRKSFLTKWGFFV